KSPLQTGRYSLSPMSLPTPVPGLVVRYAFLWSDEAAQGRTESRKDRPCVIVLATIRQQDGRIRVRVAPITHRPHESETGLEIPQRLRKHLGLDEDDCWVALAEMNEFVWPGPDLRPISRERPGVWSYGIVPVDFFDELKSKLKNLLTQRPT